MEKTYKVYPALFEDVNSGWVWISENIISERGIVKIERRDNGKSVFCEAIPMDENFLRHYNDKKSRRIDIDGDAKNNVVINGWYRKKLGITKSLKKQRDYQLAIIPCNCTPEWLAGWRVMWHHPQVVVRTTLILAAISVGLAAISIWKSMCD